MRQDRFKKLVSILFLFGCFLLPRSGFAASPAFGGSFTTAGAVDDNATINPFQNVTVSDSDGDNVTITITYNSSNGTLAGAGITGTAGNYVIGPVDTTTATSNLQGAVFTPTANQVVVGNTVSTLMSLVLDDGSSPVVNNISTNITATSINDNPVITSNGGGATGTVSINENNTSVTTVTATDVDISTTITFSLTGGADSGLFTIVPSTGELLFSANPDFENPADTGGDNTYEVQVTATDNHTGSLTDNQLLTVFVNNENDTPVITSNGGGSTASINVSEGNTAVTTVIATDQDAADSITFSITGGQDAADFNIAPGTGVLTFAATPNFELPADGNADNNYEVTVTATDNGIGNLSVDQDITVTVDNVNETPSITSNGGGITATISMSENLTAVTTVTATDPDAGDTITFSVSGGLDAALFSIGSSTGDLVFNSAPSFEVPADSGANNVYDVVVTATDSGVGNLSVTQTIAITINNANDPPVITSDGGGDTASLTVLDQQNAVTTLTATDTDPGDTLTFSVSGGADGSKFSINGTTGALTFTTVPDFDSPGDANADNIYEVQVRVTDNGFGNLTDTQLITITVTNSNEAPIITSSGGDDEATETVNEEQTTVVTVTASDADGDNLAFSIVGGADEGKFAINSISGALFFVDAPDFETPTDSNSNNVYEVTVAVTDDGLGDLVDTQEIEVTVADINEEPEISGTPSTRVDEDSNYSFTPSATDPDSDTLTYSITNIPTWASFNTTTGALTGVPENSHVGVHTNIVISVTDGEFTKSLPAFDITVVNTNDDPVGNFPLLDSVVIGDEYSFTFSADDDDGDRLVYTAQLIPDWLSFDPLTQVLSGTPGLEDLGSHDIILTVSDGTRTTTSSFTLIVVFENEIPVITGEPVATAISGQLYSFTVSATDADGDDLDFSFANNPSWLSINEQTGLVSGTPGEANVGVAEDIIVSVDDGVTLVSLPAFSITVLGDLDGDGEPDDTDSDIDGDGIDNDFETQNGLDPRDASDALEDADNDGIDNLTEYLEGQDPTRDNTPPEVAAPDAITINATGLFTEVTDEDLGEPAAIDSTDGELTATSDAKQFYQPGIHTVTWKATDAAGNSATDTQTVNIIPMANFSFDQTVPRDIGQATIKVVLNGDAVEYPVVVPYAVSGTAEEEVDHSLAFGEVTIASGREASITFNVLPISDDTSTDSDTTDTTSDNEATESSETDTTTEEERTPTGSIETVEVTMGAPTNAVLGKRIFHTTRILDGNVAPRVTFTVTQGDKVTRNVKKGGVYVVVTATVIDANPDDTHTYEWTSLELDDVDVVEEAFTFSPDRVGTYRIKLAVSDDGNPVKTTTSDITINVISKDPELSSTADTDGDGVDDKTEGNGDADGDGIVDYLDIDGMPANILPQTQLVYEDFIIETEPGLTLTIGNSAFELKQSAATIDELELPLTTAGISRDDFFDFDAGLFEFVVRDLPEAGQSVNVVIPQNIRIPKDAVYRKGSERGWQYFVEDGNNRLYSAPGSKGFCPSPGDDEYAPGLTQGHWCVQLLIEDGGLNDADGAADYRISDPGGIGTLSAGKTAPSSSGGGSIGWLLILLGIGFGIRRQINSI